MITTVLCVELFCAWPSSTRARPAETAAAAPYFRTVRRLGRSMVTDPPIADFRVQTSDLLLNSDPNPESRIPNPEPRAPSPEPRAPTRIKEIPRDECKKGVNT